MDSKNSDVSLFAKTTHRNEGRRFGIKESDRFFHMYVIGKTGVGKSTLLETLIFQDIERGRGLTVLDPHGELVKSIVDRIPPARANGLIYFNVADPSCRLGFNPIQFVPERRRGLAAAGLLDAFKKLWSDSWGPRLEHLLRNALFTLLEQPQGSLADLLRLFHDRDYRAEALRHVKNEQVREFWLKEYAGYPERLRGEAVAPLQNKVGAFLADPLLRRILTGNNDIHVRDIMDNGKILLVNLSKGIIGEDVAGLLGALLVSRINLAALSRADTPSAERRPFFCYLDEFQTFSSLAFITMLSELRKYRVGMTLGHQYLDQLDPGVQAAILGNVGTQIVFRVGAADAELFAQEFYPHFTVTDFTNLPNHHVYLKLMIDGMVSKPFSAETLAHLPPAVVIERQP